MGNLPISAHITVVSTTPAAIADTANGLPGAASATADGADFSNLLAGQIAAKVEALVGAKPDSAQPEQLKNDVAGSLPAAVDPAANGLAVVGFIPLSTLPVAALAKEPVGAGGAALRLEPGRGALLADAREKPAVPLAALPSASARTELPANLAGQAFSLPGQELGEAVRDALSSAEAGLKPTTRVLAPDLTAAEGAPGLLAHGVVAAKVDTGPVNQAQLPAVSVERRVGAPGWGAELGQKVVWLANQQQQVAQINVTPPNLGPIEIRLNLSSDQASAIFISPHAAVRDAIEAALPRLRDMLAESGLTLGNVDVSSQSFGQAQQGHAQGGERSRSTVPELATLHAGEPALRLGTLPGAARAGQGLVDIFA